MDKVGGDTGPNDDLEVCQERKKRRRRQILYNIFDFLAIVTSIFIINFIIKKKEILLFI